VQNKWNLQTAYDSIKRQSKSKVMRFISKLQLEHGVVVSDPTWDQVREALTQLDGNMRTIVSLSLVGRGSLLAGGGDAGRYIVVYFSEDKNRSLTLADLSLTGSPRNLTVEGVISGPFSAKRCVKLPLVLRAFECFLNKGELPNDITWEI